MSESRAHKRAKRRAVGRAGEVECPLPGGLRLDACTRTRAVEIERSSDPRYLAYAIAKVGVSGRRDRLVRVPHQNVPRAVDLALAMGLETKLVHRM
jgi:hypothetical protein